MRIGVFNVSRREVGGAERYLNGLLSELIRRGRELLLVHEVDIPDDRQHFYFQKSLCVEDYGTQKVCDALERWNPDLIYVNSFSRPEILAPLIKSTPAVFFCHDYVGTCISGRKMVKFPACCPCDRLFGPQCLLHYFPKHCGGWNPTSMWNEYQRQTQRLALLRDGRFLITASEAMRTEYIRHGFEPERVLCLPIAPDTSCEPEKHSVEEPWRLMFAGRMDDLKGGELLLQALPRAASRLRRRLRLVLAGDGPLRCRWQRTADRVISTHPNLVDITFTGWLPAEQMNELFTETDLLALPSLWPEPFGLCGLEAGRHGIPTVAFSVGGIPDWLHQGVNGYLAPGDPPSAAGLSQAIVCSLKDPRRYSELSAGASLMSKQFTLRKHVDRLTAIFDQVLDGKNS